MNTSFNIFYYRHAGWFFKCINFVGGSDGSKGSSLTVTIIAAIVGASILTLVIILCILVVVYHKRKKKTHKAVET